MSTQREQELLVFWRNFYHDHFNIEFEDVKIPVKKIGQGDFARLLVVAKGLTLNKLYDFCARKFECARCYEDLDRKVSINERDPNKQGSYAIWVRDSADTSKIEPGQTHRVQTLMECMLHELVYFLETKEHLVDQNLTLCSGSSFESGVVPNAGWRLHKFWIRPGGVGGRQGEVPRFRKVVF